jgi:Domain of unknown function (DUF397)
MREVAVSVSGNDSAQNWRKSSKSYGNAQCVEVAGASFDRIHVRDSVCPQGPVLRFTQVGWTAFLGRVRSGTPAGN